MWIAGTVLAVLAVPAMAVGAVLAVGALLPAGHTARCSARLPADPGTVWAVVTDIDGYPSWRPGLRTVERLPDVDGRPRWRERDRHGVITYEVTEAAPPSRLVTRIADDGLPFGGTWTYEVSPDPGGSTVTVTEDGVVRNPVFRFVSRFETGHTATIDAYLKALAARLGRA